MISISRPELKWVEVDGVKFAVREERFADVVKSMQGADGLSGQSADWAFAAHSIMARIEDWEGIEYPDGTKAPCDDASKSTLFGGRPDLLNKIGSAYVQLIQSAEKNLEPSQNGTDAPVQKT